MPRILVVEDNAINRELLCDWLEAQDMQFSVRKIWAARSAAPGRATDAVLLDGPARQ